MPNTALIQVLGAVAYGEHKAYEGARQRAEEATDPEERREWRTIAAQELRHHKGFVKRLEAIGADPERAMRRFHAPLDRYHGAPPPDPVDDAVRAYLGEGIADDLLLWLRKVVDAETAAFIDTVIVDEEAHEAKADDELRQVLAAAPHARRRVDAAVRRMLVSFAASGRDGGAPLVAFLRLGRPHELLGAVTSGYIRRARRVAAIAAEASRRPVAA